MSRKTIIAIVSICVALGAFLRLICVDDMEYKGDERMMVQAVEAYRVGHAPLESMGFHSGVGLRHPSFSIQIFQLAGRIFNLDTPTSVCRFVMVTNALALVLFLLFALYRVEPQWSEAWLWGTALLAVNPMAIQLHRKIWAPSILPLFCAVFLWVAWTKRPRLGTFAVCGFLLGLMSQIHLSGFFLTAALFLGALFQIPKLVRENAKGITAAVLGFGISMVFSRQWLLYLLHGSGGHDLQSRPWKELLIPRAVFFWFTEPFGFHLGSAVGSQSFFAAHAKFFAYPKFFGHSTYGVALSYAVLFVLGLIFMVRLVRARPWKSLTVSPQDRSSFFLKTVPLGTAVLYELSITRIVRHYLLILTPLMHVGMAAMIQTFVKPQARKMIVAMLALQLLLAGAFLQFIHLNGGAFEGDYWISYRVQQATAAIPCTR